MLTREQMENWNDDDDRIAALEAEVADLREAIDAQEQEAGYGEGGLWRFWADKARKYVTENKRLRADLREVRLREIALQGQEVDAASPAPSEAVRVKSLEWEPFEAICTREKAPALGGHYCLVEFDKETDRHFSVNLDLGGLSFRFLLERDPLGGPESLRPIRFQTEDEAKAAAQADYEARVLSALASEGEQPC